MSDQNLTMANMDLNHPPVTPPESAETSILSIMAWATQRRSDAYKAHAALVALFAALDAYFTAHAETDDTWTLQHRRDELREAYKACR